ncbi:MAG: hypothetical protein LCH67_10445, partial [Bacteroidetes bacterium]|nr:hypothetical protein [Bacteroidota bacterium]
IINNYPILLTKKKEAKKKKKDFYNNNNSLFYYCICLNYWDHFSFFAKNSEKIIQKLSEVRIWF